MTPDLCIDECVEWILRCIEGPEVEYKYTSGEGWEFLIFSGDNISIDSRGTHKIEVTTRMILVQIKTKDCRTDIWFGRKVK